MHFQNQNQNNTTTHERSTDETEPTAVPQPDIADQLVKLASLRDAGILTEEEFTAKKTELLERL